MKSIQEVCNKNPNPLRIVFPALLFLGTVLHGLASPNVVLWDTVTSGSVANSLEGRAGWQQVPTDLLTLEANPPKASSDPGYYGREYVFKGDAVVENQKIAALFGASSGQLVLYAKQIDPKAANSSESHPVKTLELSSVDSKVPGHLNILRNTEDEVVLEIAFPGASASSIVFSFGASEIVDIHPSHDLKQFRIVAPLEYAVAPGFIGDDLIYHEQEQAGADHINLPSENLLLGLLNGHNTSLVMTWPKARQHVRLGLGEESKGVRPIRSIDFDCDGQSFYLAPLSAPGIWHKEKLTPVFLEKDVAIDWKRPFPAKWKTQLFEEAVPTTFAFRLSKGDIWRGVPGSYNYPVWFDGEQTFYRLGKKVVPKGESLIYFLEGQGTPTSILTPAEVLKATLGRQASEPILDVAGRKLRTHHRRGGDGVHRACTCGCTEAIQAVFEAGDEVARKEDIKGDLEDMVYFVHHHVDRINEYQRFAEDMIAYLQSSKTKTPELREYLDGLEQTVRQIPQECSVQQENMKSFAYADELVRRTMALTDKNDPGNLKAYMDLLKEWRAMGGAQDYVLAQCHIVTRKLAQQAGYGCANAPKAVPLAEEIRSRARQCLRNPDGYEIWADY